MNVFSPSSPHEPIRVYECGLISRRTQTTNQTGNGFQWSGGKTGTLTNGLVARSSNPTITAKKLKNGAISKTPSTGMLPNHIVPFPPRAS